MSHAPEALAADRRFFDALTQSDVEALKSLLSEDFVLVDVMSGSMVAKPDLIALVGSGQLKFESIEQVDARARVFGNTVVVVGHTEMRMRFEQTVATASSRYTHVYVQDRDEWRMVSAQGTPIADQRGSAAR